MLAFGGTGGLESVLSSASADQWKHPARARPERPSTHRPAEASQVRARLKGRQRYAHSHARLRRRPSSLLRGPRGP